MTHSCHDGLAGVGPWWQYHTLVLGQLQGGLHVAGKGLVAGQPVENQGNSSQHLITSACDGDGTLRVTGGQLCEALHTDGGAGVLDQLLHGNALVTDEQATQAARQGDLDLR